MKASVSPILCVVLATLASASAQTNSVAIDTAACATLPELLQKIPALPQGSPCAKPLFTITQEPAFKTTSISPLVGPEIRQFLNTAPETYSLDYIDVTEGTGTPVLLHKFLSVKYAGYLVDGTKFDASDDHPEQSPFVFQYGEAQVISGWNMGLEGMKVGGKRRLFVPYQLAYGVQGRPPAIPPKSMLVFDIEVVDQRDTRPEPKTPTSTSGMSSTTPATSSPANTAPKQ